MSINITIINREFEDNIKINNTEFKNDNEYKEFLKYIYKFEFNKFLINANVILEGESYNDALDMYIELDFDRCLDNAMERIARFNDYIDQNNKV